MAEEITNENPTPAENAKAEAVPEKAQPAERKADAFEWTYAAINLVCLATVLLAMIFGAATLFTTSVNPISAINNIIALFSIRKGNIYSTLAGVAVTAVYVAFLILMIKSTVNVVKLFIKVIKNSDEQSKWNNLYLCYTEVKGVTLKAVIFMALCFILSGGELTVGSYFVITVFLISYVLISVLLFVQRNKATFKSKETVTEFIFRLIRMGAIIACACLSAKFLVLSSGQDLAFGVRALFSGVSWSSRIVHTLYDLIIKHVLDIVLAMFYLKILDSLFLDPGFSKSSQTVVNGAVKDASKKLMIIAAVSAVAYCILLAVSGFNVQFNSSLFVSWFYALKVQYLPAIMITAALFAITFMPLDDNKQATLTARYS